MKLAGWAVSAGLVLAAASAHAQMLAPYDAGHSPYRQVSDFEEPYGGMPPAPPPYPPPPYAGPGYAAPGAPYGYDPSLMPPHEVYAVLRENGFLPLGIPHRRGYVYEISAMDPEGEDGRLVVDGHTGRIIRFMPADWGGRSENYAPRAPYGYGAEAALPPPTVVRGVPRPPAAIPHVASRAVPLPAPKPSAVAARPAEPVQQSAATATPPVAKGTIGEPLAPQIRPTQDMPAVQGLE